MADAKRALMEGGGNLNQKFSGRLIPKRGQVTMTAVAVLLHSFSSLPSDDNLTEIIFTFHCFTVLATNPSFLCCDSIRYPFLWLSNKAEVPNVHSSKNGEHSLPLLRLSFRLRPYLKQVFFTLQSQSQLCMAQIDSRNSNIFQLIRSHQKNLLGYLMLRSFVRFLIVSASIATPQNLISSVVDSIEFMPQDSNKFLK
ncbi:hypothetical protein F8388_020770 [Cannabis sativa]|uniref:Uncharacterized protein n=1 Tax=Cannabis sativa TaxID=3483 RepID=A0A7J6HN33_CANSA|nr:hypothetical protein F8388_020770 [Cannabis sativa]KAF4396078.1 hypothetical protein G4B88_020715 [Cannabis sativa]